MLYACSSSLFFSSKEKLYSDWFDFKIAYAFNNPDFVFGESFSEALRDCLKYCSASFQRTALMWVGVVFCAPCIVFDCARWNSAIVSCGACLTISSQYKHALSQSSLFLARTAAPRSASIPIPLFVAFWADLIVSDENFSWYLSFALSRKWRLFSPYL